MDGQGPVVARGSTGDQRGNKGPRSAQLYPTRLQSSRGQNGSRIIGRATNHRRLFPVDGNDWAGQPAWRRSGLRRRNRPTCATIVAAADPHRGDRRPRPGGPATRSLWPAAGAPARESGTLLTRASQRHAGPAILGIGQRCASPTRLCRSLLPARRTAAAHRWRESDRRRAF